MSPIFAGSEVVQLSLYHKILTVNLLFIAYVYRHLPQPWTPSFGHHSFDCSQD